MEQIEIDQMKRVERMTYSIDEAAEALGVGRSAVYNLCHVEGFPRLKIGKGGKFRIPIDLLKRWMEENSGGEIN